MTVTASPDSFEHVAPFKYIGGDPALDLVNTVDWTDTGTRRDRLTTYDRLADWAEGAGIVRPEIAQRLRQAVEAEPDRGREALDEARNVRGILRSAFRTIALGEDLKSGLEPLGQLLATTLPRLRLEATGSEVAYTWAEWGEDPSCLLWPVIFSGAELLTSTEAGRVGMCPGDGCGWMFVDRSRNGMRKWCEMATCGTTAKNRRRRRRAGQGT